MNGLHLPGPGTAMALFAAVAIYTAGFADLSGSFRWVFLSLALGGVAATLLIEWWYRPRGEEGD